MKSYLLPFLLIIGFSIPAFSSEWPKFSCKTICVPSAELPCTPEMSYDQFWEKKGSRYLYTDNSISNQEEYYADILKDNEILLYTEIQTNYAGSDFTIGYELDKRTTSMEISVKDHSTGEYTELNDKTFCELDELKVVKKEIIEVSKKDKISNLKKDCKDIGFKDGTEAMGNCVLKLMELQVNNSPTVITTTTSNSSQEIVDIEKQKLQAQREALKLQQDQLKAEQARVAQERRKAIQRNANKSIQQGKCLMNGGSTWDCM